jgi:hypothetical protein
VEYESVTRGVLIYIKSLLQKAKQLQHARLDFVVSDLKNIDHGNTRQKFRIILYNRNCLLRCDQCSSIESTKVSEEPAAPILSEGVEKSAPIFRRQFLVLSSGYKSGAGGKRFI